MCPIDNSAASAYLQRRHLPHQTSAPGRPSILKPESQATAASRPATMTMISKQEKKDGIALIIAIDGAPSSKTTTIAEQEQERQESRNPSENRGSKRQSGAGGDVTSKTSTKPQPPNERRRGERKAEIPGGNWGWSSKRQNGAGGEVTSKTSRKVVSIFTQWTIWRRVFNRYSSVVIRRDVYRPKRQLEAGESHSGEPNDYDDNDK